MKNENAVLKITEKTVSKNLNMRDGMFKYKTSLKHFLAYLPKLVESARTGNNETVFISISFGDVLREYTDVPKSTIISD